MYRGVTIGGQQGLVGEVGSVEGVAAPMFCRIWLSACNYLPYRINASQGLTSLQLSFSPYELRLFSMMFK